VRHLEHDGWRTAHLVRPQSLHTHVIGFRRADWVCRVGAPRGPIDIGAASRKQVDHVRTAWQRAASWFRELDAAGGSQARWRRTAAVAVAFILPLAATLPLAAAGSAWAATGYSVTTIGGFGIPAGVAEDPHPGTVYVVNAANNRIGAHPLRRGWGHAG
jgi:hypothetical protein